MGVYLQHIIRIADETVSCVHEYATENGLCLEAFQHLVANMLCIAAKKCAGNDIVSKPLETMNVDEFSKWRYNVLTNLEGIVEIAQAQLQCSGDSIQSKKKNG